MEDFSVVLGEISTRTLEVLQIAKHLQGLGPSLSGKKRKEAAQRLQQELEGIAVDVQEAELRAMTLEKDKEAAAHELQQLKQWHQEKGRYEECTTPAGGAAYRLKPDGPGEQSRHYLCATCFLNDKKAVLQPMPTREGCVMLRCHTCGSEVMWEKLRGFMDVYGPEWER
ncbi:hypothetical protein SAMN05661010_00050 [Modicisalibacter muralis]|uniref:Uncharacterized protein n=1 Tax=Modicisalibacter muralis TaxID=119000 RepID=A0A1G9ENX7_9GAMM|nr:hypothetical protein [Halomonas muralis]SDK77836.1 hypothetical protein SAMN05661010_00050 [Halomonas muralis]